MPMNGAVGRGEERRVSGLRSALSDKRLSHNGERPAQAAPGAQEPICPAVPSPIPALGSAPPSSPGGGGTRWHRLLRGGPRSPQQLVEGNAQLWEGGQRIQCGGRLEPHASLPAHPPQGCTAPPPQPLAPQAPAQGPEVRGRPPLVVCLEGRGRGEKPAVGLAEGLTGSSTTLA